VKFLERLLDGRDFDYLAAHPGFDRQWLRMFRSQRREMAAAMVGPPPTW
jgi:hypothetical protein